MTVPVTVPAMAIITEEAKDTATETVNEIVLVPDLADMVPVIMTDLDTAEMAKTTIVAVVMVMDLLVLLERTTVQVAIKIKIIQHTHHTTQHT